MVGCCLRKDIRLILVTCSPFESLVDGGRGEVRRTGRDVGEAVTQCRKSLHVQYCALFTAIDDLQRRIYDPNPDRPKLLSLLS